MGVAQAFLISMVGGVAIGYYCYRQRCKKNGKTPISLLDACKGIANSLHNIQSITELSYDFIMKSVAEGKPDDERVECVALMREETNDGKQKISIVYMDKQKKPIYGDGAGATYGCSYIASSLSKELQDLFEKQDLVILE